MLRTGPVSPDALRRFRYEAEILARLRHPAIARVLDVGAHRIGDGEGALELPYFALEFVEGARSIRDFARTLTVRDRLELFCTVCDAVQYGHRMGVIHRDLKPANVLVDRSGNPRIIDYGIARVEHASGGDTTMHTQPGQVLGTPEYMSPEQLDARGQQVDTRTDVYALGALLYEMLVGVVPLAVANRPLHEAARVVHEELPIRARTRNPELARELDWILGKALEKDPDRRYGSVDDLVSDLRSHLAGEPVAAGPPALLYTMRVLLARHRVAVLAAAGMVLALVAGAVAMAFGLAQARTAEAAAQRERARAQQAADRAALVSEFLTEMLASAQPQHGGPGLELRDVIDAAASLVGGKIADEPLVRAAVSRAIGRSYHQLGFYREARLHLETALELRRAHGQEPGAVQESALELAILLRDDDDLVAAERLLTTTLDELEVVFGADSMRAHDARFELAVLRQRQGQLPAAIDLHRRVAAARQRALGRQAPGVLDSLHQLARALWRDGTHEEAESLLREVGTARAAVLGRLHADTLSAQADLRDLLVARDLHADAIALQRELVRAWIDKLGPVHATPLRARHRLAVMLLGTGDAAAARTELLALRPRTVQALGEGDQLSIECLLDLALASARVGEPDEALDLARRAAAMARTHLGDTHVLTTRARAGRDVAALTTHRRRCATMPAPVSGGHACTLCPSRCRSPLRWSRSRPSRFHRPRPAPSHRAARSSSATRAPRCRSAGPSGGSRCRRTCSRAECRRAP